MLFQKTKVVVSNRTDNLVMRTKCVFVINLIIFNLCFYNFQNSSLPISSPLIAKNLIMYPNYKYRINDDIVSNVNG